MTRDFGVVAITSIAVAFIIGLNEFYDRSVDNLYSRQHDCLTSLISTYDVLLRRAHLAKLITADTSALMQEQAISSDIDTMTKWSSIQAACVQSDLLNSDSQVGGALREATTASDTPLTANSADPTRLTGAANWARFAIKEVSGVDIWWGWVFACNPGWCPKDRPNQKYQFGNEFPATN